MEQVGLSADPTADQICRTVGSVLRSNECEQDLGAQLVRFISSDGALEHNAELLEFVQDIGEIL